MSFCCYEGKAFFTRFVAPLQEFSSFSQHRQNTLACIWICRPTYNYQKLFSVDILWMNILKIKMYFLFLGGTPIDGLTQKIYFPTSFFRSRKSKVSGLLRRFTYCPAYLQTLSFMMFLVARGYYAWPSCSK